MTDSRQLSRAEEQRIDDKIRRGIREYFKNGLPSGTYGTYQWDGTKIVSGGAAAGLLFRDYANVNVNSGVSGNLDFSVGGYDPGSLWASSQFTAPRDGWFFFSLNMHITPTGGNIAAGDIAAVTLIADSVSYRLAYFEAYNTPASAPAFIHLSGAQTVVMASESHATIYFQNLTTRTVQIVSGEHCSLSIMQVA